MAEFKTSKSQLGKGIKLSIGTPHVVKVVTVVPRVRLTGMFFDLDKSFLLPSALPGARAIKSKYDEHPGSNLLIVGHTDTSDAVDPNLELSQERADSLAAFLTDQTAPWEAFFDPAKEEKKRWGTREIQMMLSAVPERGSGFYKGTIDGSNGEGTKKAIRDFQTAEGIVPANGVADAPTLKQLIFKYMDEDETTLPAGISITTVGAGESFPDVETGDGVRKADNRRTEIFFFDGPITPPPPADKKARKGSKEYPAWLAQVTETTHFASGGDSVDKDDVFIQLHPPAFDEIPADATLTVTPKSGPADVFMLKGGLDKGDGLLRFLIKAPQPGMLYTAEVRLFQDEEPAILFSDFELHQLVAESKGGASATVSPAGADGLAFKTPDEPEPDDSVAVVGGPVTPTDGQLAQIEAQSGNIAAV
jgi:hypothetical protein